MLRSSATSNHRKSRTLLRICEVARLAAPGSSSSYSRAWRRGGLRPHAGKASTCRWCGDRKCRPFSFLSVVAANRLTLSSFLIPAIVIAAFALEFVGVLATLNHHLTASIETVLARSIAPEQSERSAVAAVQAEKR